MTKEEKAFTQKLLHSLKRFIKDRHFWFFSFLCLSVKLFFFDLLIGYNPFSSSSYHSHLPTIPAAALIIYSILLLLKNPSQNISSLIINLGTTLLMLVDVLHIRYFGTPFSILEITECKNFSFLGTSVISLLKVQDIIIFLDFILLVVLVIQYKPQTKAATKREFVCLSLIAIFLFSLKPGYNILCHKPMWNEYEKRANLINYNFFGYHFVEAELFIKRRQFKLSDQNIFQIQQWFSLKRQFSCVDSLFTKYAGVANGKNILFIQMESFAGFLIHYKTREVEITPSINFLADSGIYFNNFHSQYYLGGSADAELLSMASLYPIANGSTFFRYPQNKFSTLPKILKERNYSSFAIHANRTSFWNRGEVYPSIGIDTFFDKATMSDSFLLNNNEDKAMYLKALSVLKNKKRPFFGILITIESHLGRTWFGKNLENYCDIMKKSDQELGEFISSLKKSRLLDSTMVVIYGDHKPYLNYKNILIGNPYFKSKYVDGNNVPCIFYFTGIPHETIPLLCGQVDIPPTTCFLLGCNAEKETEHFMGRNMLCSKNNFVVFPYTEYLSKETSQETTTVSWRKNGPQISNLIIMGDYFRFSQTKNIF
jgi:lipoteichoic acid synthase